MINNITKNIMKKILITGSSGYIGSSLYFYLKNIFKVKGIDKKECKYFNVQKINLLNKNKLNNLLKTFKPDLVIHLAAQSLVDETINKKKYYINNVIATKNLLYCLKKNHINNLVFSSTAAVYKYKNRPLNEKDILKPLSNYAKTKYQCERLIKNSNLNSIILRFFNVCSSMKIKKRIIGELHDPETHLIPTVVYKCLFNKKIYIYGNNYKTKDGTCERDYIHIKDICSALKKSVIKIFSSRKIFEIINIGSSSNISNLEIIDNVKKITKMAISYKIANNRKGDIDKLSCSSVKAKKLLSWYPVDSNVNKIIKDEILWVKFLKKNKIKRRFKNYL
jgi:UDP-glucose 4-epimerase